MDIAVRTLENAHLRLEPLDLVHREDLRAACAADPDIWSELYPYSMLGTHFDQAWERFAFERERGLAIQFAVVVAGRCMGVTYFGAISRENASVNLGGTYYHPAARGGAVNPAAKRLMFGHAFDSGARRVELTVDALNHRSRAAVLKLGAVQEGIRRQDRVVWTGRVRDTVVFSVLADEWPAVRDRLDERLAGFGR
jgi:RimJ/RimL family protein N-acetyltransferase